MKRWLLFFFLSCFSCIQAQPSLPFYYEQNLPLYGHPTKVAEYYYEYHTQVKAHYYNHTLQYDPEGRIKTHIKTNQGLVNPDSIPPTFQDIIDPRAITITYSFDYDRQNRLVYFRRHQFQEEVGSLQQDEEWNYDAYGMLIAHNFWTIEEGDTTLKNPSTRRTVYRDSTGKVLKIEKYSYSFDDKGLIESEVSEFDYTGKMLDTITFYQVTNGQKIFHDRKYAFSFEKYDPTHPDSMLFASFLETDADNSMSVHTFQYDSTQRMIESLALSESGDTLDHSTWTFAPFEKSEDMNGHVTNTYFDETGYETYEEEFEGGSSLGVPADKNTRLLENGRIQYALLEIWDPVTLFYRKDTEYLFYYDAVTGINPGFLNAPTFEAYPTPTTGELFLKNGEQIVSLELVSIEGHIVSLSPQPLLHLNVPRGLYRLRALFQDGTRHIVPILLQ